VSALIGKMNVEEPEDDKEAEMDEEDDYYLENESSDQNSDDGEYGELRTKDRLSDSELEDALEWHCDTKGIVLVSLGERFFSAS